MKMINIFYLILTITMITTACTSKQTKLKDEISKMETELKDSLNQFDQKKIGSLISLYKQYSDKYSDDTLCAQYLLKAGDLSASTGKANDAIVFYDKILQQYPSFSKTPEVLFLKAFTYENHLHQYSKAIAFYKDFISRYPDHELTDDANIAIRFMGKSPEEMVKYFEQINDSISKAQASKK